MSESITFYTNPMSRGRIVHWLLEESGADYEVKLVSFALREHKAPAYLSVNPMGKLPAIVHRGTVITEAAAICAYVADAFPAAKLAPALDEPARGTYLRWMFFGAGCVEPAMIDQMFLRPVPERPGVLGYGSYSEVINVLDGLLSHSPWLLGDRFSAADIYVGSQIGWGMMMKTIEPRASFQAYLARQSERPAFKHFIEKSEALKQQLEERQASSAS